MVMRKTMMSNLPDEKLTAYEIASMWNDNSEIDHGPRRKPHSVTAEKNRQSING
jgi:hypothetical protein